MEYIVDAKDKKLGRLASEIAVLLQGKESVFYEPRLQSGVKVVVKNVKGLGLSGRKSRTKVYYRHTGPLGHLKIKKYEEVFRKNPGFVLRHAVRLMLPKNRLQAKRLKNLIIE